MILDTIENLKLYKDLCSGFEKVIEEINKIDMKHFTHGVGKIKIDEDFIINVNEENLRSVEGAKLEAHDQFLDIHIPLTIEERIGYKNRNSCVRLSESYPEKDLFFYDDRFDTIVSVPIGSFAIFLPNDAHAPIIGEGVIKKLVVKVRFTDK